MSETDPSGAAPTQATVKQRFLGGVAWSGLARAGVIALGLFVTAILARLLEPEEFGLLAMAMVFIGAAQQARDFGVGQALVRLEKVTPEAKKTAFSYAFATSLILYLALLATAAPIARFYSDPRVAPVLRVIGLTFPLAAFTVVPTAMLRRNMTLRGEAIATLVSSVLDSAVTIAMAYRGLGVWALVWGKIAGTAGLAAMLAIASPWRPGLRFLGKERGEILRFGGGVTASGLLWYGYTNADFLIVGRALGSAALGVYTMAWNVAKMPWDRLWMTVNPLVLPLFSRAREDSKELGRVLCAVTRYTALFTFPALAGLAAVSDDLVPFLLGEKWRAARGPLIWLCVLGVFRGIALLWAPVLVASGKVGRVVRFNLICFVLLPLTFIAGLRMGITGVAVAWAIVYPAVSVLWLMPSSLEAADLSVGRYLRILATPAAATLIMLAGVVALGFFLPLPTGARLLARIAAGAALYALAVRLIAGPILPEIRGLLRDTRHGILA